MAISTINNGDTGLAVRTILNAVIAVVNTLLGRGTDIASAGTTSDIGASTGRNVNVTGATTITAFPTAAAGITRRVTFTGALILTHNATNLILPGGANITTAAGDTAQFESLGSGNWKCAVYQRASGKAVIPPAYSEVTGTPTIPAALTDPNVAHIASDGNDGTGDGTPGKPYLTAQAAINAGFRVLELGVVAAGDITFATNAAETLYYRGQGATKSTFGTIWNPGYGLYLKDLGGRSANITVYAQTYKVGATSGNLTVEDVLCTNEVTSEGATGVLNVSNPGNAGTLTLLGACRIASIGSQGGGGDTGDGITPGQNGGNAGAITVTGPSIVTGGIHATGGSPGGDGGAGAGSPGSDGWVTLRGGCIAALIESSVAPNIEGCTVNDLFIATTNGIADNTYTPPVSQTFAGGVVRAGS